MTYRSKKGGFTIVELLIVVVVISILAAITIVGYNGIQNRARISLIQSNLSNASKQMELASIDSVSYPTAFPVAFKASDGLVMSLSENGSSYCINAEYKASSSASLWYFDPSDGVSKEGTCPGAVIAGSEIGANPNLIEDTTFQNVGLSNDQWGVAVGGAASFAATSRAGVSTDPNPNRRVLQVVNSSAKPAASFVYLRGPANEAEIVSGASYTAGYYVRLASGTHNSSITHFAIMTGSATNSSIPYQGNAITPSASWQKVTRTVTASQNGVAGTFLYLGLGLNDLRNSTFTLEFQGFELRRN